MELVWPMLQNFTNKVSAFIFIIAVLSANAKKRESDHKILKYWRKLTKHQINLKLYISLT